MPEKAKEKVGLVYLGGGSLPGIPARDLTPDEVKKYGGKADLKKSGLYGDPKKPDPGSGGLDDGT